MEPSRLVSGCQRMWQSDHRPLVVVIEIRVTNRLAVVVTRNGIDNSEANRVNRGREQYSGLR
jgi:hypothetical protein